MNSSTISAYTSMAANLPDEVFLGQIVLFTIVEGDVNLTQLRDELVARNLRAELLKSKLRPIDAFKKASNEIAVKFEQTPSQRNSLLVRPVGQDRHESHRHVVYERAIYKSGQPRRVEHETIWKLMYDRGEQGTNGIFVEQQYIPGLPLEPGEQKWIDDVIGPNGANLKARFEHYCTHLNSHGLRTFVRDYLTVLGAINVKGSGGGGLYFVQQKHAAELRDLADLVLMFGSYMHTIPLLDIVDQRDMLAEAFVADTLDELRQLSADMSRILTNPTRTITEETYESYVGQAATLMAKASEYEQLLGRSLDTANFELELFKTKTLNLHTRIRKPKSLGSSV